MNKLALENQFDKCIDALAQALRLAYVPERAKDYGWENEYWRLIELEGKMRAEAARRE